MMTLAQLWTLCTILECKLQLVVALSDVADSISNTGSMLIAA